MAVVTIPDEGRTITDRDQVSSYLASVGIDYDSWPTDVLSGDNPSADVILSAYTSQIERLKAKGGYVTADVIDMHPNTPGLETMLAKFNIEHTHDEDEVRYVVAGRGLFSLHIPERPVINVEVVAGDLLRVPRGVPHWFNLCGERRIRAIRLFQNRNGWIPYYTASGVDRKYQPVCFGPAYVPVSVAS